MIVLHHLNRSRSFRIAWLLEELNLEYELRTYLRDIKTGLAPPELRTVHPLGKAPMIELEGLLITESAAIVEALCDRFGQHLVPEHGSDDWIRYLEWMHFAEGSAMLPILLQLYLGRVGDGAENVRPRIDEQLHSHFSYMDESVRACGFFLGEDLSAADIMLSFPAEIATRGEGLKRYTNLVRFLDVVRSRPAFSRALKRTARAESV